MQSNDFHTEYLNADFPAYIEGMSDHEKIKLIIAYLDSLKASLDYVLTHLALGNISETERKKLFANLEKLIDERIKNYAENL